MHQEQQRCWLRCSRLLKEIRTSCLLSHHSQLCGPLATVRGESQLDRWTLSKEPFSSLTSCLHPCLVLSSLQALHGDIAQTNRERVLKRFREGKTLVLVATDVAARGLDIPNVDLVVHYELPNVRMRSVWNPCHVLKLQW